MPTPSTVEIATTMFNTIGKKFVSRMVFIVTLKIRDFIWWLLATIMKGDLKDFE